MFLNNNQICHVVSDLHTACERHNGILNISGPSREFISFYFNLTLTLLKEIKCCVVVSVQI